MKIPRKSLNLPCRVPALLVFIDFGKGIAIAPIGVEPILDAIKKYMKADPRYFVGPSIGDRVTTFDKDMKRVRKRQPSSLYHLKAWLEAPVTQATLFESNRDPNFVEFWLKALEKIQRGARASEAFASPGKPRTRGFKETHLEAMEAERLFRGGMALKVIINKFRGNRKDYDSNFYRWRKKYKVWNLPKNWWG